MTRDRVRVAGAAPIELPAGGVKPPKLSADVEWTAQSRRTWRDWWGSPMASMWANDVAVLHGLIRLENMLETAKTGREAAVLATAIRLSKGEVGLTPLSRRRLNWVVPSEPPRPPKASRRGSKPSETPSRPPGDGADPAGSFDDLYIPGRKDD